jgi:hypothetical protein
LIVLCVLQPASLVDFARIDRDSSETAATLARQSLNLFASVDTKGKRPASMMHWQFERRIGLWNLQSADRALPRDFHAGLKEQ